MKVDNMKTFTLEEIQTAYLAHNSTDSKSLMDFQANLLNRHLFAFDLAIQWHENDKGIMYPLSLNSQLPITINYLKDKRGRLMFKEDKELYDHSQKQHFGEI